MKATIVKAKYIFIALAVLLIAAITAQSALAQATPQPANAGFGCAASSSRDLACAPAVLPAVPAAPGPRLPAVRPAACLPAR